MDLYLDNHLKVSSKISRNALDVWQGMNQHVECHFSTGAFHIASVFFQS